VGKKLYKITKILLQNPGNRIILKIRQNIGEIEQFPDLKPLKHVKIEMRLFLGSEEVLNNLIERKHVQ
jgi:hypothetical protein